MPSFRSTSRVGLFATIVTVSVSPRPGAALQASGQTEARDIGAVADSIEAVEDTLALLRLEQVDSDDRRIEGGFAAMRLFRITGQERHARLARAHFEKATDLEPDNAWAWFGLGTTWADGPELRDGPPAIVTGQVFAEALGRDAGSRAVRSLQRALENDPGLVRAAVALVPIAIVKRDQDALVVARRTLARAEEAGRFSIDALRALADAERALGNVGRAVDVSRRVATMSGDDPESAYDLARALFADGRDDDGTVAWFQAVDGLTEDLAERLHDDLAPLATEWEDEKWQRATGSLRSDWLRGFWDTRAALGGVSVAERIGDHYRRLAVAADRYFRRRKWGAPPINALLLERPDLPFDDRGIIYVRHGEPFDIMRGTANGLIDSESWAYRSLDGGFRLLNFFKYGALGGSASGNPGASPADGMADGYNEFVLVHDLPCGDWVDGRRLQYDRRLALLRCEDFERRSLSGEVRRDVWEALRSDSDSPDFDTDLPFASEFYTFRGDAGLTDVTAAILVAADSLSALPAFGGVAYELDVSVIIADTMFGRVARTDTMLRLVRPDPIADGRGLRIALTRTVTPGPAQAQRIVVRETANPGHGQMYGGPLDVPDYGRRDLMISDIVLAEPDSGGAFRRGDIALSLVPTREFPGGAFQAFYEVYNLAPDSAFSTEIVVEKASGGVSGFVRGLFGGGPEVRLRFDGVAPENDSVSRELRRVDTSLGAGDYRIRVSVTELATGRTAEREREFTVVR